MSDENKSGRRAEIKTVAGRALRIRRRITFMDDRVETFYTSDGTGYPRFDEDGVVRDYFHTDGRPAYFRQKDIKQIKALG